MESTTYSGESSKYFEEMSEQDLTLTGTGANCPVSYGF